MEKANILAHRGLWEKISEKNTKSALFNALENGFGIETDLRFDKSMGLVISHDILNKSNKYLSFEELLIFYKSKKIKSKLAINIKSDGLHSELKKLLNLYNINEYFLFDMSIPDLISGVKYNLNQFIRFSCYEDPYPYADITNGVWIDIYNSKSASKSEIINLNKKWSSVVFVSPELHGQNHLEYWNFIKSFYKNSKINNMLCTDLPNEAYSFFNN